MNNLTYFLLGTITGSITFGIIVLIIRDKKMKQKK
jgi:hypothetical protein